MPMLIRDNDPDGMLAHREFENDHEKPFTLDPDSKTVLLNYCKERPFTITATIVLLVFALEAVLQLLK